MTALPIPAAPQRLVGGLQLTRAASEAAAVDPETMIRGWLDAKSPTARRTYARSLTRFAAWALGPEALPHAALHVLANAGAGPAHAMVEGWRDELLAEGLASGTVAGMVTALCSLVRCARRAGLCSFALEGVAPKVERREDRSGPRLAQVQRMISTVDLAAAAGKRLALRDAGVLRLLFSAGLRRGEVVGLRWPEHVDLEAGVVRPRRKGCRERQDVTITPGAVEALRRYVDQARGVEPGPLFVDSRRRGALEVTPMSAETVRRSVALWAARAGLQGPVRPHGLRHSGATVVAERAGLAALVAFGGWRSLSAASRYLDQHRKQRDEALALTDL